MPYKNFVRVQREAGFSWNLQINTKLLYGSVMVDFGWKSFGFEKMRYDGDFYILSLGFMSLIYTDNPHCVFTQEEIHKHLVDTGVVEDDKVSS